MDARQMSIVSLLLLATAALLIGGTILHRTWQLMRSERILNRRIELQQNPDAQREESGAQSVRNWWGRLVQSSTQWIDTSIGRQLVAEEDRMLLDQCGINDSHGKGLFFLARILLALILPVVAWLLFAQGSVFRHIMTCFFGLGIGFMLPKWFIQRKAADRRRRTTEELPLLIDLLRLLQGVGLSIDQSMHVIESEFSSALPILSKELQIAARQYMNGRTREQSLHRLSTIYDNDDLSAIAKLIVQVDRYGGAVQQPLQQFSDRIREQRKLYMKEKVGKLTVKMTGVMVLTLMPALLIITGGSGFVAIIRTLAKVVK